MELSWGEPGGGREGGAAGAPAFVQLLGKKGKKQDLKLRQHPVTSPQLRHVFLLLSAERHESGRSRERGSSSATDFPFIHLLCSDSSSDPVLVTSLVLKHMSLTQTVCQVPRILFGKFR